MENTKSLLDNNARVILERITSDPNKTSRTSSSFKDFLKSKK